MMKTCGTASSLFADATSAVRTWPGRRAWLEALCLLAVLTIFALFTGSGAHLFTFASVTDWPGLVGLALIAIIIPALGEEMVFRVWLAGLHGFWRGGAALALFLLWHPAQLWLGVPTAQPVFANPAFLAITAALGLACTISYRRSGSIWPAVAIHWAVVMMWKGLTLSA